MTLYSVSQKHDFGAEISAESLICPKTWQPPRLKIPYPNAVSIVESALSSTLKRLISNPPQTVCAPSIHESEKQIKDIGRLSY
jgi:hypothetical protein